MDTHSRGHSTIDMALLIRRGAESLRARAAETVSSNKTDAAGTCVYARDGSYTRFCNCGRVFHVSVHSMHLYVREHPYVTVLRTHCEAHDHDQTQLDNLKPACYHSSFVDATTMATAHPHMCRMSCPISVSHLFTVVAQHVVQRMVTRLYGDGIGYSSC